MHMVPLLSIITPVYNGSQFVTRAYANLLEQSFTEWEWIVVDDGSTDNTYEELLKISDSRVRVVSSKPNRGRGYARTMALDYSSGLWIVVWDIDDIHFPDRLSSIASAAKTGEYDFFCSYAVAVDDSFNVTGMRGFYPEGIVSLPSFVHPTLGCSSKIAREIGYSPILKAGEDARIIWTLSLFYKGCWSRDILTIYREGDGVSLEKSIASNIAHFKTVKELYERGTIRIDKGLLIGLKYMAKVALLMLMRLFPNSYAHTVKHRDCGQVAGSHMSEERLKYLEELRSFGHEK